MAKKVSDDDINKMIEAYARLHTYSAVAKEMGLSPSTVSRYIKEAQKVKTYDNYSGAAPMPAKECKKLIERDFWGLTSVEQQSLEAWLKEYYK